MAATLLLLLLAASPVDADVVVVAPAAFHQALSPWLRHRAQQGHRLALVSNTDSPEEIRQQIREVAKAGGLRFVVLVGDVPVYLARAKVNVFWGSEPLLATDNWYADLDDDQVPDLAIGRLTAGSPAQLRPIVDKILAYERSRDFGLWRRQLNVVAGLGGFGPLADTVLESAVRYFLTQNIPAAYRLSMTYGSWRSPYCPDPRQFRAATLERLNEGSWFWVYLGHGHPLGLDHLRMPGGEYPILDAQDVPRLNCVRAGPIALLLSCYEGAIDRHPDCLATQMLCQPGGPVAVVAGSRVTMPYAMSVLGVGLMNEIFVKYCPTLGEALLKAKQNMLKEPAEGDQQRVMLDTIASAISPMPNQLAAERLEHVLLFNLIGDPLLRLRYPREIKLEVAAIATAGGPLRVSGMCPIDGRGTVELVVPRGRLAFTLPPRREYPRTSAALAEFQEVYRRANDVRLAHLEVPVHAGRFEVQLNAPPQAEGACQVAVYVEGDEDFALGAADVNVQK